MNTRHPDATFRFITVCMYITRTYDVAHGDVIGQSDLLTDTHELAVSET